MRLYLSRCCSTHWIGGQFCTVLALDFTNTVCVLRVNRAQANGADETDGDEPRTPLTVITSENDYFDGG